MAGCLLLLVLSSLAVVSAEHTRWHQLGGYTFEAYQAEFHKAYDTPQETARRAAIFADNLAVIQAHNAKPGVTWKMGVNHFTDLTPAEFSARHLGRAGASRPRMDTALLAASNVNTAAPSSVDWRDKGIISPVKNQGGCGSCWAFASTEMIESYVALATGYMFTLSPQQLVSCAPNPDDCGGTGGCQGSIAELAFEYISKVGMTTEWVMPYTSFRGETGNCTYNDGDAVVRLNGWVKLPENNETAVFNYVASSGPLAVNVQANVWQSYESGVFTGCDNMENIDIDHVVQLVGYGTDPSGGDYWLIRNSWDVTWGEKGYIRLSRDDNCGTDPSPQDGTGCSGGPPSVRVCGRCGVLYDTSYPTGARLA